MFERLDDHPDVARLASDPLKTAIHRFEFGRVELTDSAFPGFLACVECYLRLTASLLEFVETSTQELDILV